MRNAPSIFDELGLHYKINDENHSWLYSPQSPGNMSESANSPSTSMDPNISEAELLLNELCNDEKLFDILPDTVLNQPDLALHMDQLHSVETPLVSPVEPFKHTSEITEPSVPRTTKRGPTKRKITSEDPVMERNRKNAILARENRQKKKIYIESLETENNELKNKNSSLTNEVRQLTEKSASLEGEVNYLKSILANQSTLSKLLQNINVGHIKLSTSFDVKPKPVEKWETPQNSQPKKYSGGICLHVAQENVSLEFCSKCSAQAATCDDSIIT